MIDNMPINEYDRISRQYKNELLSKGLLHPVSALLIQVLGIMGFMLSSVCLRIWFTVEAIPLLKSVNSYTGSKKDFNIFIIPNKIAVAIAISQYLLKNFTVRTTIHADNTAGIRTKIAVVKKLPI